MSRATDNFACVMPVVVTVFCCRWLPWNRTVEPVASCVYKAKAWAAKTVLSLQMTWIVLQTRVGVVYLIW